METGLLIPILSQSLTIIISNKLITIVTLILLFILRRMFHIVHHRCRFPVIVLKPRAGKKGGRKIPVYCAVCQYDVAAGERYRKLPQCHHCFHVVCIDPRFELKSTSPLCRSQVPVDLLPRRTQQKPPSFFTLILYYCLIAIRGKIIYRFSRIQSKVYWM
ncbi:hypothetical protein L2E82_29429 [Cichorium intybus]|uniref:Uncharacterized protein n=1 Tax=Cichorium intybus TaxID=13427 RepID=A0ACB9CXJ3_CICIN|nr:hypothetical protein L2E82_29429 [Cichorium intybus]